MSSGVFGASGGLCAAIVVVGVVDIISHCSSSGTLCHGGGCCGVRRGGDVDVSAAIGYVGENGVIDSLFSAIVVAGGVDIISYCRCFSRFIVNLIIFIW